MAIDLSKINAKEFMAKAKKLDDNQFAIVRTDPWVPIEFRKGDETINYKLELSFGAVKRLFRSVGKNIQTDAIDAETLGRMDFMVAALLAGIQTHHPEVTEEQLEDLISMKHRLYYVKVLQTAMEATQPAYEDLAELIAMSQQAETEGEAEATVPLVEIVESPISGQPVGISGAPN